MPRYSIISFLLLLCAIVIGGCGTTDPASTRNTMTAVIDRTGWRAIEVTARRESGRLILTGTSAIDSRLALTLHGDTAGTYQLGAILNEGTFTDGSDRWVAYGINSGSVTVTAIDSIHVAGYFGFQARDTTGIVQSREIAGGTFDIDFTP